MTDEPGDSAFATELQRWALLAIPCAGPSFGWALLSGFRSASQLLAMSCGVGLFVLAFAAFCSRRALLEGEGGERVLQALRTAVWWKVCWTLFGFLGAAASFAIPSPIALPIAAGGLIDFVTGGFIAGPLMGTAKTVGPFLSTLSITLLQGAAITAELLLLAVAANAWRSWSENRAQRKWDEALARE